jgi:phage shock protein PspC (stress-responsive transcriptional regulator)
MKKVININFQGRVIPIEETAYDILKSYIESLRGYFSKEEGRDEIINDIESRVAELFSYRLSRGTPCITDEHVNEVIASIGRPEELEEAEREQGTGSTFDNTTGSTYTGTTGGSTQEPGTKQRSLYRSENDKILGGVSAGLANYFGIDPSIMRLIFVLFLFMGFGILLYIILWIVVPARVQVNTVRKRLYRNPDTKMIGGVAGGIAAYLNIDVWIPRIVFLSPFILGVIGSIFRRGWMHFDPMPNFFFNGFGGSLFVIYIVLWIVLPQAHTSTEKMEMRGEKVDLESISKTVKEDLENLKGRAEKVGGELRDRAMIVGQQVKTAGNQFTSEAAPFVKRTGSGLGHAIGVLFKAFFLFIAGVLVFALLMFLIAILFSGVGAFPFKDFLLDGFGQNMLAWGTLLLFLGVPIIALLIWLVRRIMGVRSNSNYLGYTFGGLWTIGWICAIMLGASIASNFKSRTSVRENVTIAPPSSGKVLLKLTEGNVKYFGSDWFGFEGEMPFFSKNEDSIMMSTVRLKLIKSNDADYHISVIKFSNGKSPAIAERLANKIFFPVLQNDSIIYLPKGFTITPEDKFRNQQVLMVVEIPVGKKIQVDRNVDNFSHFNVDIGHRRGWNGEWDDRWDNAYYYNGNVEYVMTENGMKDTREFNEESESKRNRQEKLQMMKQRNGLEIDTIRDGDDVQFRYRYKKKPSLDSVKTDTTRTGTFGSNSSNRSRNAEVIAKASTENDLNSPLYPLLMVFQ